MAAPPSSRKRPAVHITLPRAARLLRLVRFLSESPRTRDSVLSSLGIGLRTFYREIELLNRCGVKIRNKDKLYVLQSTAEQAEGRLPFPDPQLSFAEMAELAKCPGEAGQRMSALFDSVINYPIAPLKRKSGGGHGASQGKPRGMAKN